MKGDDVSWSIIPMIGKCTLFDPRKYFQMYKTHQDLIFAFKLLADISIRMFLIDGERASSRIIKSNNITKINVTCLAENLTIWATLMNR